MNVECILSHEFPHKDDKGVSHLIATSNRELGKAWVFVDHVVSKSNVSEIDILKGCWNCKNRGQDCVIPLSNGALFCTSKIHCEHGIDPHIETYTRELDRIIWKKAIDLCLYEEHLKKAQYDKTLTALQHWDVLEGFWDCPKFAYAPETYQTEPSIRKSMATKENSWKAFFP